MIKYLIQDKGLIKSFDSSINEFMVIDGKIIPDNFINNGMDVNTLNIALNYREQLLSNSPRIYSYSDSVRTIKLNEVGLPLGETIDFIRSINFDKNYILGIKNILIEAEYNLEDTLSFIFSLDDGLKWVSFFNNEWIDVRNSTVDILERGMDIETINSLNESDLQFISTSGKLKIKFYMKKRSLESPLKVKKIKLEYNTDL